MVFFEQTDNGGHFIKRGRKQANVLAPISQYTFEVTPDLSDKIERARQQMREGKVTVCKTKEENQRFLDSL